MDAPRRARRTLRFVLVTQVAILLGCGESGSSWSGAVTDSAGVRLVRNPAEPSRTPFWTVEPVLQISESASGPEAAFSSIQDVAIDAELRVLVLDDMKLKWFDADGRFLFSAGGVGDGPGEFTAGGPFQVLVGVADSALVPDGSGLRAAVFGPDGRFGRQFSLPSSDLWPRQ